MSKKGTYVENIYRNLLKHFGRQGWWPITTMAEKPSFDKHGYGKGKPTKPTTANQRFEIIVGAILTQNTAWTNVEKVIENLKERNLLTLDALHNARLSTIKNCIRPAGYFNQKAKKLCAFTTYIYENFDGNLQKFLKQDIVSLRKQLLSIWGIGEETADSIILYAANKPGFVVDAYTRRIFSRLGLIKENATYGEIQTFFESSLPKDVDVYKEYHALIVELAKQHCKSANICDNCAIEEICGYKRKMFEKVTEKSRIVAGKSIENALKVVVPPEVIKESSFIEGIMDLAYLLQKSGSGGGRGGIKPMIRDGVTGLALGGAPVSMWSALFADGCKVVGKLFDVPGEGDMENTARYFYNLSDASKDFRRMWMSPESKELKDATISKLEQLKEGATKGIQKTVDELEELANAAPTDKIRHRIHDKLLTLANLKAEKTGFDESVKNFFEHMDPEHIRGAGSELQYKIIHSGYDIEEKAKREVDNIYSAFEIVSSKEFNDALDEEFSVGKYALKSGMREARGFANSTVEFVRSLATKGAKTGHMFGSHYWGQLKKFLK